MKKREGKSNEQENQNFLGFGFLSFVKLSLSFGLFFLIMAATGCHHSNLGAAGSDSKTLKDGGVSPPKAGELVPDFRLPDRNGKLFSLSSFRGNIVFLNFWATWCGPCREEFPLMEELNQRFKAKNFTMIAVSIDDSWGAIDEFIATQKKKPSFLILRDADKELTTKIYNTTMFPETYIIGTDGKLLRKYAGVENWLSNKLMSQFNEYFSKKTQ